MPSILLSGPAGSGKSQEALKLLGQNKILADFSATFVSIRGVRRDPATGRYPVRRGPDGQFLPLTEQLRRDTIRRARAHGFDLVVTNANGSESFRRRLLALMGPGAKEVVVDPGREVVEERLKVKSTGIIDPECSRAVGRWYDRLNAARG